MGASISGYVKAGDYTHDSDGTFTCKISYNTELDFKKPRVLGIKTQKCIGSFNVNNIKSPNSLDQAIILSDDNKYIFYPIIDNQVDGTNYSITYYISAAVLKYNIKIPDAKHIFMYFLFASNANKAGSERDKLYKAYEMGKNPPSELFIYNSDPKTWSDISYIFKVLYDLNGSEVSNYTPPTYCIKIDSPALIDYAVQYDCRSKPNASPNISGSLDDNTMIIAVVIGVVCVLCICGVGIMIMMRNKSKKNK
jgi:hypothetical protein